MTGLEKLAEELRMAAFREKQSLDDVRQYGVNSAAFNAYLGRYEMATEMHDLARQLLAAEPRPTASEGLAEEMQNWKDSEPLGCGMSPATDEERSNWHKAFDEILAKEGKL